MADLFEKGKCLGISGNLVSSPHIGKHPMAVPKAKNRFLLRGQECLVYMKPQRAPAYKIVHQDRGRGGAPGRYKTIDIRKGRRIDASLFDLSNLWTNSPLRTRACLVNYDRHMAILERLSFRAVGSDTNFANVCLDDGDGDGSSVKNAKNEGGEGGNLPRQEASGRPPPPTAQTSVKLPALDTLDVLVAKYRNETEGSVNKDVLDHFRGHKGLATSTRIHAELGRELSTDT
ncbi:hypothetical protein BDZ89DRAFT_1217171 [Hymenopellis radicata]|nr:hypothetical protein BDZ89DRAFT_1217171 [Hymenopellis radicata]